MANLVFIICLLLAIEMKAEPFPEWFDHELEGQR